VQRGWIEGRDDQQMLIGILSAGGLVGVAMAIGLVAVTVTIHALGFDVLLRAMIRWHALGTSGLRRVTLWVIGMACWLIVIHLVEISVWGLFYFWRGGLPDAETALYFSGTTYTTAGYGDVVLPRQWRMFAPLEALTGILMCGLSAGLFFAVVFRWISARVRRETASEHHSAPPMNK